MFSGKGANWDHPFRARGITIVRGELTVDCQIRWSCTSSAHFGNDRETHLLSFLATRRSLLAQHDRTSPTHISILRTFVPGNHDRPAADCFACGSWAHVCILCFYVWLFVSVRSTAPFAGALGASLLVFSSLWSNAAAAGWPVWENHSCERLPSFFYGFHVPLAACSPRP